MTQKCKLWMTGKIGVPVFFIFFVLFLVVALNVATASTIYVPDDYALIQDAVDAASPGDTIIVREGTYEENIGVYKRLTTRSENGPDSTVVQAEYPDLPVFEVAADYVNLSGFTVKGAYEDAGICLYIADYCYISNNICSENEAGIFPVNANNNDIYLNNFMNNDENAGSYESSNTWSSPSKITYTYNGKTYTNYLGNYWDDYSRSDRDKDGIGDSSYRIDGDRDRYPLMEPWEKYI